MSEVDSSGERQAWCHRFEAACSIARAAGQLALGRFRQRDTLEVERKRDRSIVSDADRAVETLIRERLERSFPGDAILGEEHGDSPGDPGHACTWVIDPIDGTDCFVNGIPVWCVSIAAVGAGEVEIGVIYDPNAEELFAVHRGRGATLNGEPMVPSDASALNDGLVGTGFSHRVAPARSLDILRRLLEAGGMYQRNGSGALMLAYVAAGRLIAYHEHHINAWDALAAIALVREVGGWTNDFLADDGLRRGSEVAVCAPGLREAFRALVEM